jgi:two-component system phosphate regulon response regulator PhoB
LVVEDDHDLRRMFRTALTLAGFVASEASDGHHALALIDSDPPDLVVLDLMLPTISGIAVQQEIAAQAYTRHIPIIIVTGSAMNLDHLNVPCVLRKPVTPDELIESVRKCLAEGAPGAGL